MPIFFSFFATLTPLVFIGRQISVLFLCAAPSEVLASRHIQSACSAVGGPQLAAVDDVVVAVLARGGLDRRDVRAGAGFGDAEAGDVVARDRRREEFPFAPRPRRSAPAPASPCRSARRSPSARRRSECGRASLPSPSRSSSRARCRRRPRAWSGRESPASPIFLNSSLAGKISASSHASTCGLISLSMKRLRLRCSSSCSWVNSI